MVSSWNAKTVWSSCAHHLSVGSRLHSCFFSVLHGLSQQITLPRSLCQLASGEHLPMESIRGRLEKPCSPRCWRHLQSWQQERPVSEDFWAPAAVVAECLWQWQQWRWVSLSNTTPFPLLLQPRVSGHSSPLGNLIFFIPPALSSFETSYPYYIASVKNT